MNFDEINWSVDADNALKRMWVMGIRYDEMVSSISSILNREIAATSMHRRLVALNLIGRRRRANQSTTIWTPAKVKQLEEAWVNGTDSASVIAKALGPEFSRNAVIGKVHRMGIHRLNPNPSIKRGGAASAAKKKANGNRKRVLLPRVHTQADTQVQTEVRSLVDDDKAGIGIMALKSDTCRAVLRTRGFDGMARYCGDKVFPGYPFCPGHCVLYYQPPQERRR